MATEPKKCANSACTCVCMDGKKFCSAYCEDARKVTALTCHCPHPECGRAFARNFNMQSHLKSHLGIRDCESDCLSGSPTPSL